VSKNVAVFVDVANLYYSARGQEVDVDYVALLKAATKGRDLIRAYAYSGLDPENENQRKFIDFLNKNGYKVVHKDIRKFGDGRVKANLDIELVVDMFRLAKRMDIAVIVSGDGDFAAAIRALQDEGVRCEVISFRPNTSSDLIAVADEFIDIMKIASIGRTEKGEKRTAAAKGMSAPEMPAKEVVPEFGFREASPGVAAAALAALREGGKESRGGRGRGRTAKPRADEAAEAPAASAVAANGDAPAGEERSRRRRRRGGRGRGRGGRGHEVAVEATTDTPEIGWTEVDDLSQLDGLTDVGPLTDDTGDEREYTFEEADEATLAELGLLDAAAPSLPEAASDEAPAAEPKPARRSRSRKADAEAAAVTPDAEGDAAPKPARRTRGRKADADTPAIETAAEEKPKPRRRTTTAKKAAGTAAGESEAAKPARRSRSRKTAETGPADAATGETEGADGEGQGIWQRFRSARGTRSGS
jgi:uncharacterized LabA/DUF88 family protein